MYGDPGSLCGLDTTHVRKPQWWVELENPIPNLWENDLIHEALGKLGDLETYLQFMQPLGAARRGCTVHASAINAGGHTVICYIKRPSLVWSLSGFYHVPLTVENQLTRWRAPNICPRSRNLVVIVTRISAQEFFSGGRLECIFIWKLFERRSEHVATSDT